MMDDAVATLINKFVAAVVAADCHGTVRICVLYYLDITSILHHIIYPVIIIYYSLILMHLTGPVHML